MPILGTLASDSVNAYRAVKKTTSKVLFLMDNAGYIQRSADFGLTWNQCTMANTMTYGKYLVIVKFPTVYIAVPAGDSNGDYYWSSPDGITWTRYRGGWGYSNYGACFGNGKLVVVSLFPNGFAYTTTDGITWNYNYFAFTDFNSGGYNGFGGGIVIPTWMPGPNKYGVMCTVWNTDYTDLDSWGCYSADGLNWTNNDVDFSRPQSPVNFSSAHATTGGAVFYQQFGSAATYNTNWVPDWQNGGSPTINVSSMYGGWIGTALGKCFLSDGSTIQYTSNMKDFSTSVTMPAGGCCGWCDDGTNIYTTNGGKLYKSSDGGANFSSVGALGFTTSPYWSTLNCVSII